MKFGKIFKAALTIVAVYKVNEDALKPFVNAAKKAIGKKVGKKAAGKKAGA